MSPLRRAASLWPPWTLLAALPAVLWVIYCASLGERRWEHLALVTILLALPVHPRSRRLLVGLYPMALTGLLYDMMRFVPPVSAATTQIQVHLCDLRAAELRAFGVGPDTTLQDWFQAHASPALDLYCAIPYGTYLFVCFGFAIYAYLKDVASLERFGWTFLALNVAGFVTYHLYPAAPPWYFHAHGCEVDLLAHASAGPNLARVDAWLGIPYFQGFYSRSHDTFGAIPSLHVAYPLVIVIEAFRIGGRWARGLSVWFFLSMLLAAVALDHHWVIDELVGIAYAVIAYAAVNAATSFRTQPPGGRRARTASAGT